MAAERVAALEAALARLPERQRQAVVLRHLEGLANPEIAVIMDVTFGKGTGSSGYQTFDMGKGLALGIGPSIHPFLYKRFKEVAERVEIPVFDDLMPEYSSTDADDMQVQAEGIPTVLVSIPLRYMHTPVEVIVMKDIQRAGRLLAEFVASLEADFIERIVWD